MQKLRLTQMTTDELEKTLEAVIRECRSREGISEFVVGATCDAILVDIREEKDKE